MTTAHSTAVETVEFLRRTKGATAHELAEHFGISHRAVRHRINAARQYLRTTDDGLVYVAIPRPTKAAGWRFCLTESMYGKPSVITIGRSTSEDFLMIAAVLKRLERDLNVAYEKAENKHLTRNYKIKTVMFAVVGVGKILTDSSEEIEQFMAQVNGD